jgi:hypothetical protein
MEVQTLLYSKLPIDVIKNIYDFIIKNRKLPFDLQIEIIVHSYINIVIDIYRDRYNELSMFCLHDHLLLYLNRYIPLSSGICHTLASEYSMSMINYIISVPDDYVYKIKRIWHMMPVKKKMDFFSETLYRFHNV